MEIDADRLRTDPDPAQADRRLRAAPASRSRSPRGSPARSRAPTSDGPPEGVEPQGEHLAEAKQPLNLILVADADLLADATWVRQQDLLGQQIVVPIANNGDFAVNALDNLAGSEGLISLRGRGLVDRPFEVVRAMEREAEHQFRAKEQELQAKIDETEAKIRQLQDEEQQSGVILTAAQQAEIENFRGEMITLRQELRGGAALAARGRREPLDLDQGRQHLGRAGADRAARDRRRAVAPRADRARRGAGRLSTPVEDASR